MLAEANVCAEAEGDLLIPFAVGVEDEGVAEHIFVAVGRNIVQHQPVALADRLAADFDVFPRAAHEMLHGRRPADRSEEHTSELQSLMRISYAVFCLKKKKHKQTYNKTK